MAFGDAVSLHHEHLTSVCAHTGSPLTEARPQFMKTWRLVCSGPTGKSISHEICVHQALTAPITLIEPMNSGYLLARCSGQTNNKKGNLRKMWIRI